ncbi:DUF4822 domain-containing protein [Enterococcus quebecensis]|uniref:DUF4822 domain-containing protein n=1 Tax=Enterococcus quebecensis TaxID=903983 RepID=A0A1E5GQZ9_9ENTE|nr:DUF4822 domain-containing protein [Enterococcus quebecensis]OEG15151.1 hypothetical protein BCR23_09950 [Enterococcus quebecensis]OJG74726.1 hypothetical protein RV12_GL002143 [Enterococcus quebecensis]
MIKRGTFKDTYVCALFTLLFTLLAVTSGAKAFAAEFEPNQLIGSTNWEGTFVYDAQGNDVTSQNSSFIGRAKYDATTNRYEFFDKQTNVSRGDKGVFFITPDGKKRILLSELGYRVVVDMVRLDKEMFTYRRQGVQKDGSNGFVFVEHVPYAGELTFTSQPPVLSKETGLIVKDQPGIDILASTFWQGTKALDADGNDVSDYNRGYLGLARYDKKSGRYEFFDTAGKSRGDFGYYDVIRDNKERTHISVGSNYAATLELTELNNKRFTYARNGKDADGKDITITVEHEPYTGELPLEFTFNPENELIVMPPIKTEEDAEGSVKSTAIVEVENLTTAGTMKFSESANTEASIIFEKLNTKDNPSTLKEKEVGKATISVVDTRTGSGSKDDWTVKSKLTDGPFGNKGFLLNKLAVVLEPSTEDKTLSPTDKVTMNNSEEHQILTVGYQEGNTERKTVTLNPQLAIGQSSLLQTGVYGATITWTLTPKV